MENEKRKADYTIPVKDIIVSIWANKCSDGKVRHKLKLSKWYKKEGEDKGYYTDYLGEYDTVKCSEALKEAEFFLRHIRIHGCPPPEVEAEKAA